MHAISLILSKMHTVRQFNTNQHLKYSFPIYVNANYYIKILFCHFDNKNKSASFNSF